MTLMHRFVITTLFIAGCSAESSDSADVKLVRSLEETLVLPPKGEVIHKYDRTYAITPTHIRGVLLINGAKEGRINIVRESELHMERMDGGCGAIKVIYDRVEKRWVSAVCNGSA